MIDKRLQKFQFCPTISCYDCLQCRTGGKRTFNNKTQQYLQNGNLKSETPKKVLIPTMLTAFDSPNVYLNLLQIDIILDACNFNLLFAQNRRILTLYNGSTSCGSILWYWIFKHHFAMAVQFRRRTFDWCRIIEIGHRGWWGWRWAHGHVMLVDILGLSACSIAAVATFRWRRCSQGVFQHFSHGWKRGDHLLDSSWTDTNITYACGLLARWLRMVTRRTILLKRRLRWKESSLSRHVRQRRGSITQIHSMVVLLASDCPPSTAVY